MTKQERLRQGRDFAAADGAAIGPGWPPMPVPQVRAPKPDRCQGGKVDPRKIWLQDRIAQALAAVHRLPSDRPKGFKSCMPTPVRDAYEIFAMSVADCGQWDGAVMTRIGATAEDVQLVDAFLSWIAPLDLFERRLVAARGRRVPWKILVAQDPRHRTVRQLRSVYDDALDLILTKIGKVNK